MEQCKELENQRNIIHACDYAPTKAHFDDRAARQQAVLGHISEATLMAQLAGQTVHHSTVQCSTVQCSTVQYCTTQYLSAGIAHGAVSRPTC
eukprot:6971644-Pyramimonas_sp.AAC.1